MRSIAYDLMKYIDVFFAAYVIVCVAGVWVWYRTEIRAIEIAVYLLSMFVMPLYYFSMFSWDFQGVAIIAPQALLLAFIGVAAAISKIVPRNQSCAGSRSATSCQIIASAKLSTRIGSGLVFSLKEAASQRAGRLCSVAINGASRSRWGITRKCGVESTI
jgi:hypothetical protein